MSIVLLKIVGKVINNYKMFFNDLKYGKSARTEHVEVYERSMHF